VAVIFGRSLILFPEPVSELVPVCRELGIATIYDGAHVMGLIAGGEFQDPLAEGCDFLVGSTHKTYFGPQRGMILSNLQDERWERIDRMAFPGSLSNHHLNTLPPLLVATLEMIAFGREYARQIVANAKRLAEALARLGFDVQGAELGFTRSHQVAVDVRRFDGGGKVSEVLKESDIICNRNLLPHDPRKAVNNPSGIRLGVQEMTRVGMKEPEMEEIARFIKESVAGGRRVRDEVNRFRGRFVHVRFSFDAPQSAAAPAAPARTGRPEAIDIDLAGY
jgi:glycine hydroxymethyltransferase